MDDHIRQIIPPISLIIFFPAKILLQSASDSRHGPRTRAKIKRIKTEIKDGLKKNGLGFSYLSIPSNPSISLIISFQTGIVIFRLG